MPCGSGGQLLFERGELRLEYLIAGQIAISQIDFERETAADGGAETPDKGAGLSALFSSVLSLRRSPAFCWAGKRVNNDVTK